MAFKDFIKDKWNKMSYRDRQIAITSAIKAASAIMEGSNASTDKFLKYSDKILEHYWQFEELQKPGYGGNPEVKKINEETQIVVEESKDSSPF